jgi:hypothetical protein
MICVLRMQTSSSTLRVSPTSRCSPSSYASHYTSATLQRVSVSSGNFGTSPSTTSTAYCSVSSGRVSPYDSVVSQKTGSSPVPVPRPMHRLATESKVESLASCGRYVTTTQCCTCQLFQVVSLENGDSNSCAVPE